MSPTATPEPGRIGLLTATALNMNEMIGIGPFITLPLILIAMHGPQSLLGWIAGAALALCDGLIWAELGASFPGSGGSYLYLRECYGPRGAGRFFSFLFVWQLSFSAPLSIASGCTGLAQVLEYLWPSLAHVWKDHLFSLSLPLAGNLSVRLLLMPATLVAMAACGCAVLLLFQNVRAIGRVLRVLWIGVFLLLAWIIVTGFSHFHTANLRPTSHGTAALGGLGAAMLIAAYDYWGYYNVCFLGSEVKQPQKNIPRAVLLSILLVATLYIAMHLAVVGAIPWEKAAAAHESLLPMFMGSTYGRFAAIVVTLLLVWTAFSSVYALLLGYSRVPYTAARDGNYFSFLKELHPRYNFPTASLLMLGGMSIAFCLLRLQDLIAALVVIRILLQFLLQAVGLLLLRWRSPETPRPFRMWLYPLPVLLAIAGFLYVLFGRAEFGKEVRYALVIVAAGAVLYLIRFYLARRDVGRNVDELPA